MHKLSNYIFKEFLNSFFLIFLVLISITSLIFIISLSNITANINITFSELLTLYILSLPQVIFIAISISFFLSAVITYSKLSETQEIIALFSLGISPFKILKPIFFVSIIMTFINAIFVFVSIPYSKVAYLNIKAKKQQVAKFKFKNKEASQRFGNWNVFKEDKIYLYNSQTKEFIIANKVKMDNKNSLITLNLKDGFIYNIPKQEIIKFKTMQINKTIPFIPNNFSSFIVYLKKLSYLFKRYIPLMILPIALFFFIPTIAFFHPRLQKNHSISYSIILLAIYISLAFANKSIIFSIIIPFLFFIIGFILFKRRFQ